MAREQRPCSGCGRPRWVTEASAANPTCHDCRRKRKREDLGTQAVLPLLRSGIKRTTTDRGLGNKHQQARQILIRDHVDGTPCDWCGRPMWLDPTRNWDYNPNRLSPNNGVLHADHSRLTRSRAIRLGIPPELPDRLLHGACNVQRGDGSNDHLAWVNHQTPCNTTQLDTVDVS